MPIPTIPLWGQLINNGINNIRDIWKTSKERYNSLTQEQKADAARVEDQWVTDNVLPVVTTVGELIPQTSIPMAAYNTSEAVKKGNYEEAFQHALTPVLTGAVSKGVNLGLKASEKAVDAAGKALKSADNYVTIQNALRTGKLRFGESKPTSLFSKGNFTRRNPSYYIGKPKDTMFDFNIGRKSAWGYLGSKRKIATDAHNKAILERITGDPLAFQVEKLPQQRSMTPMQKPVVGTQMNDGEWVNLGDNGFFLYSGKENEAGLTFRFKNAPEKDQMYLSTDYDLDDTAFHEYLHRGNMGVGLNGKTQWFYNWKNRSILKPGFENFRDGYLVNPEETAVNLLEIGRRADVINTPYPGFNKAKSIIQDIIKADAEKGAILDQTKWETKPKRVWDALQGKYIGLIPIGASLMLKENNNE